MESSSAQAEPPLVTLETQQPTATSTPEVHKNCNGKCERCIVNQHIRVKEEKIVGRIISTKDVAVVYRDADHKFQNSAVTAFSDSEFRGATFMVPPHKKIESLHKTAKIVETCANIADDQKKHLQYLIEGAEKGVLIQAAHR